jgi:GNAT superfamily N-acetyltransferase
MSTRTSDAIVLRRAGAGDVALLNAIVHGSESHKGAYAAMLEGYAITAAQVARDHFVLAEDDGGALGFYSLITGAVPELDLMFVVDRAHGRGIGAVLFEDMRAVARRLGIDEVLIVSHPPAAGFYERMGAVRVGVKPAVGRVTWDRPMLKLKVG